MIPLFILMPPLIGGMALLLGRGWERRTLISIMAAAAGVPLLTAMWATAVFDPQKGYQFVVDLAWIPSLGVRFQIGLDGLSMVLVDLTVLLSLCGLLTALRTETVRVREHLAAILVLETGMIGVFMALDFFLFYLFWEMMLIPMYLLIGIWGGERRIYATLKFFIYTLAGSVLLLLGILILRHQAAAVTGVWSLSIPYLTTVSLPRGAAALLFWFFFIGFAVKIPVFPFHTWLPDAHVQAPAAGSVLLAGVLLKMGGYGILRVCLPLFPEASRRFLPAIAVFGVAAILYGALLALAQSDLKRLVAYSSVSHMGFVVLGIAALTPQGLAGSVLHMVNHGLITGGLFIMVGFLYRRTHSKEMDRMGGLAANIPRAAVVLGILTMAAIGLPGLNGFVGEFLILVGTFMAYRTLAVTAAVGIILGAVYMLWMYRRVMFGPPPGGRWDKITDLDWLEMAAFLPLLGLIVFLGLYPQPFLDLIRPSVENILKAVGG